jgi:hypothetical protein
MMGITGARDFKFGMYVYIFSRMGEVRGAYNIWVGGLKGGDHYEDLGVDERTT